MYIEDLILLLADKKVCPNCGKYLFCQKRDRKILQSFRSQILKDMGFTQKQLDVAIKIIFSRSADFVKHNIDFITVTKTKLPVRTINRLYQAGIKNNKIVLNIPFDSQIIDVLRERANNLKTRKQFRFENYSKTWTIDITDANLFDVYSLIYTKNCEKKFDSELEQYMKQIADIVNQPTNQWDAKFNSKNQTIETTNSYVDIDTSKPLYQQVTQAVNAGLTINSCVFDQLCKVYGKELAVMYSHRYIEINNSKHNIADLVNLVITLDLKPIVFDVNVMLYEKIQQYIEKNYPQLLDHMCRVNDKNVFTVRPSLLITDNGSLGYGAKYDLDILENIETVEKVVYYNDSLMFYDYVNRKREYIGVLD